MTERPLPDVVQRQLATHKLTKFYKAFAPEKLANVPMLYDTYRTALPKLFAELLVRYPRCPRDFFDDVLPNLSIAPAAEASYTFNSTALPSPLQQPRGASMFSPDSSYNSSSLHATQRSVFGNDAGEMSRANHQESISSALALLQRGESLLEATPSVPMTRGSAAPDEQTSSLELGHNDDNEVGLDDDVAGHQSFNQRGGDDSFKKKIDQEALDLRLLIQENRQLARDVATVEQQVLQRRFELMFLKLVEVSTSDESPSSKVLMTIRDDQRSERVFVVECSAQHRYYMMESAIAAPHAPVKRDMCTLVFRAGSNVEQHTAQRNVVAMAMRVWSRKAPHTVSELPLVEGSDTVVVFHPSTTLWWQWPELCTTLAGVTPQPMLHLLTPQSMLSSTYLPALVAKRENDDAVAAQDRGCPIHPQVANVFAEAPPPPSASLTNSDAPATTAFWSHFVLQWETLSQQISHGKLPMEH